jgi:hypothetical protein
MKMLSFKVVKGIIGGSVGILAVPLCCSLACATALDIPVPHAQPGHKHLGAPANMKEQRYFKQLPSQKRIDHRKRTTDLQGLT